MCEPVTATLMALKAAGAAASAATGVSASAAIGGATALTSYMGQKQAADAQEASQAAASKAEQIRAGKANTGIRIRQAQENIARAQRMEAQQLKGMSADSRQRLIALTEAGVSGQSLGTLLTASAAEQARYRSSEKRQEELEDTQRSFAFEDGQIRTRMNQLRINQPIKQASLLQAGLQGIQAGLSTSQALQGLKPPVEAAQ